MKLYLLDRIKDWWNDDSMEIEYISGEQHIKHKQYKNIEDSEKKGFIDIAKDTFSLNLTPERKQTIANNIIQNSDVDKLYWIQLIISCMLATLGLLSNSVPVIIGSMLVSPILTPIQSFAFAVTCGNKNLYMKSLKILIFSIVIAIISSFLVCYFVPFASITEQVLLRGSPTIIDLIIALLSGIIAFIFLGSEKLEESIVGIAIAVSLMPPLASVGIGLHFLDYSVAQGTFLLFITNLVGILVVGILIFFLFGFKPTNKLGKKRTDITLLLVLIFIGLIMVPLWKSMTQIAETQKTTTLITSISNDYLYTLDEGIKVSDMKFRNTAGDTIRITAKLDVPSDYVITNFHKDDLTKKLSAALGKSVELDLDIVEISSVYIDNQNTIEQDIVNDVSEFLSKNSILVVDYTILNENGYYFFFDVYVNSAVKKNDIYNAINTEIAAKYGSGIKIILQWQDNPQLNVVKKSDVELNLEKQFYALFPSAQLTNISVNYSKKLGDNDDYIDYAALYLEFSSPYAAYQTNKILSEWKTVLEEYLGMNVDLKAKFVDFSLVEL